MDKETFFQKVHQGMALALSFEDVGIAPAASEVLPAQVDVSTYFSRRIKLNIPLVSAAMDKVTEYQMAIAMALAGGIGVIHRAMSIEQQARQVARVKWHLNGRISKPKYARPHQTIEEVQHRITNKGYTFRSFPVIDDENTLVGVLSGNDIDLSGPATLVSQAMTHEPVAGGPNTSLGDALTLMRQHRCKILPLADEARKLVGLYIWSDVQRILNGASTSHNVDPDGRLRVAAAIGPGDDAMPRAEALAAENVDALVIDASHAHTTSVIALLKALKDGATWNDIDIVAGNISQTNAAVDLAEAGADAVKVGQGPGSICTTGAVSGVSFPQLSAIYNAAQGLTGQAVPLIADGGLRLSGDITKALAAGADSVMLGSLLAGTAETPGEVVVYQGNHWKDYRGMGSTSAMAAGSAGPSRYAGARVPQGVEARVPFRGPVEEVIHNLIGGLQVGMGATGSATISQLKKRATFYQVTAGGNAERHPHDVAIAADAPNYHS